METISITDLTQCLEKDKNNLKNDLELIIITLEMNVGKEISIKCLREIIHHLHSFSVLINGYLSYCLYGRIVYERAISFLLYFTNPKFSKRKVYSDSDIQVVEDVVDEKKQ